MKNIHRVDSEFILQRCRYDLSGKQPKYLTKLRYLYAHSLSKLYPIGYKIQYIK